MGGIELLQDLVHDGVGEIGNHWQLHFSAEDWVRGKCETDGKRFGKSERKSITCLSDSDLLLQPFAAAPPPFPFLHLPLTLKLGECPAPLFPSEPSEWQSEGWTRARRRMRAEDSTSPPQKKIRGRARDRETPLSRRSPATEASDQKLSHLRQIVVWKEAVRSTWSSLSAALASSPARESSLCRTGPSTDSTWASSHSEGYSWEHQNEKKWIQISVWQQCKYYTHTFHITHSTGVPGLF